jgi:Fur family peroxide stress response transcriptional regulator
MDPEVSVAQDLVQQVEQQSGYQIVSHRLDFYGVCPDCREGE